MKGVGLLAISTLILAMSAERFASAAQLDVIYTGDVRGTLGVCG